MQNGVPGYYDPIVQKIIKKLEDDGPSRLVGRYINGDVLYPNTSDFPLCYIAKDQTDIQPVDNMEDGHELSMVATIIFSLTDDLDGFSDMVAGTPDLYETCEGRDSETLLLKSDTLAYVLRANQQIADKLWIGVRTPVRINYGLGVQRRGPNTYSVEAVVRFTVTFHQPMPEYYS